MIINRTKKIDTISCWKFITFYANKSNFLKKKIKQKIRAQDSSEKEEYPKSKILCKLQWNIHQDLDMVPSTSGKTFLKFDSPTPVGFLGLIPFLKTNASPKPLRKPFISNLLLYKVCSPMYCSPNVEQKVLWLGFHMAQLYLHSWSTSGMAPPSFYILIPPLNLVFVLFRPKDRCIQISHRVYKIYLWLIGLSNSVLISNWSKFEDHLWY